MTQLIHTVRGNRATDLASFSDESDARAYVGGLASRGDWRGFSDISIWRDGSAFYVAERGLTHFT